MSAFLRPTRAVTLLAALLLTARPAHAQQEVKTTPAKEVAANPQRYWARGVVFRDELISPPGKETLSIAGTRVHKFTTKTIGDCYADERVLAALQELAPSREYIFAASVFSQQTGFLRKKTHYRVVVNGIIIPADNVSDLPNTIETAIAQIEEDNPLRQNLVTLKNLIVNVQEALTAMAATEQISRAEYLNPKSESFDKLIQTSRRAINDLETETKVPGREQLAQILASLVALEEGALKPAPQPAPPQPTSAATNTPDAAPAEK
ncbi:MAG: hypothetical protein J5I99_05410 [Verrucomicrobia bacterium]|nr:hypothetical protein [Kiritimatiellia bacterium]MCO6400650.1 hypothetical protein [Verrucomicrobiota bacterium]